MPGHPAGAITKIVIFGIISRLLNDAKFQSAAIVFRQNARPPYEFHTKRIAGSIFAQEHYCLRLVPSPYVRVQAKAVSGQSP